MTDEALVQRVLEGDADAMRELDARVIAQARRVAATVNLPADELAQLLRERLHVEKKLSSWQGAGPLDAWLRTVAIRAASNARRLGHREVATSTLPEAPMIDPSPELGLLRAQYREQFRAAFTAALASLGPDDRTVLRLHTLDGLSLATIGTMFHKDASNVSRWLARLRATLLERTRDRLAQQLALDGSALESVMRVADSELTMSLSQLLVP